MVACPRKSCWIHKATACPVGQVRRPLHRPLLSPPDHLLGAQCPPARCQGSATGLPHNATRLSSRISHNSTDPALHPHYSTYSQRSAGDSVFSVAHTVESHRSIPRPRASTPKHPVKTAGIGPLTQRQQRSVGVSTCGKSKTGIQIVSTRPLLVLGTAVPLCYDRWFLARRVRG